MHLSGCSIQPSIFVGFIGWERDYLILEHLKNVVDECKTIKTLFPTMSPQMLLFCIYSVIVLLGSFLHLLLNLLKGCFSSCWRVCVLLVAADKLVTAVSHSSSTATLIVASPIDLPICSSPV